MSGPTVALIYRADRDQIESLTNKVVAWWVMDTPENRRVILESPDARTASDVTYFKADIHDASDEDVISMLPVIEDHHAYQKEPYTDLVVIGVQWSPALDESLRAFGYASVEPTEHGCVARGMRR
ncbi:MAG: hypothetical protein MOGMAGMI_00099 [Candidatus Omnitrophica bacterium]|nr:hypothetical protein [Candidatus Omnitrophota bacterium]